MKQSFLRGVTIASFGVIFTKILGVLYAIPFNRIIGEGGAGLYFYGYNVYILFINVSVAGIPFGISKLISNYHSLEKYKSIDKAYNIARKLMIGISVFVFVVMFIFAEPYAINALANTKSTIYSVRDVTIAIRSVSFALLFVPMLAFSRGFLQGFQEMTTTAKSQIVEQVARIVFLLGGVYLCMYVFDLGVKISVYTALVAAFVGAAFGYLVVFKKVRMQKKYISESIERDTHDAETTKLILKKLFHYSLPFILLSMIISLYNQVNVLTIRPLLESIGYSAEISESIFNSVTGWGPKLNRIVFAFTVGFNTALIPSISGDYARGQMALVKRKTEQSLQLILIIVVFLTAFCSVFSEELFAFFFSANVMGPITFKVSVFTTLFHSYMYATSVILQSTKHEYISILVMFIGWLFKLILNEPMVHFLKAIGLEAGHGFALSTMVGFGIAIILNLLLIRKFVKINLRLLTRRAIKLALITLITFGFASLLKYIIPYSPKGYIEIILYLGVFGVLSLTIYLALGFYSKLIQRAVGEDVMIDFRRKLGSKLPFIK